MLSTTNTEIKSYLPVFKGFYNTIFDADCIIENDNLTEKQYDKLDFEDYRNRMSKECTRAIDKELKRIFNEDATIITFETLISPKYYNFSNDSINVTYTLNERLITKINEYLIKHKAAFAKFLLEQYTSRPGFIPFYDNDTETWFDVYLPDIDKRQNCFGSILEFIFQNENYTYEQLYYDTDNEHYVSKKKTKRVKK